MEHTKLAKKITGWKPKGVRTKGWPNNRREISNKLFKQAKTEKLEPRRQRQKSVEWSGAENQKPWRVVASELEQEIKPRPHTLPTV